MEFTKKIKTDWLNALKSGKYNKGIGQLKNINENSFCCLGVLCEITPNLDITEDGMSVILNGETIAGYKIFNDLLGSEDKTVYLYNTNDNNPQDNFKNVIPLIERIPTVD